MRMRRKWPGIITLQADTGTDTLLRVAWNVAGNASGLLLLLLLLGGYRNVHPH
jgi:hypothetical protein